MKLRDFTQNPKRTPKRLAVTLEADQWDDVADLIDAGFELLEKEDEAYVEQLTRSWDKMRLQLAERGYDWDPKKRAR